MWQLFSTVKKKTSPPLSEDVLVVKYGQSNCVGTTGGVYPESKYITPSQDAKIVGTTYLNSDRTETFETLTAQFPPNNYGDTHGTELSLAYEFQKVWICKVARGGSSINYLSKTTNTVYPVLLEYIGYALAQKNFSYIFFEYDQWEGDSLTSQNDYYNAFIQLVSDIESDAGITFHKLIVTKARNQASTDYTAIESAQQDLVTHYVGKYILENVDNLDKLSDDTHYTSASNIIRGSRVADIIRANVE